MWVTVCNPTLSPGWDCRDRPAGSVHNSEIWPSDPDTYVDEGTAVTMCDVFNARDYPEVPQEKTDESCTPPACIGRASEVHSLKET